MVKGTRIPPSSPKFTHQEKLADCTDEFLANVTARTHFVPIHRACQLLMFVVFFGAVKFFAALIAFVLWAVVLAVLPHFERFFAAPLAFKRWSHSVARHLVRLFLLALGVVRIDTRGAPGENARIYAANSLSAIDVLIHFCATPITIVSPSEIPEWERFLIGSVFDCVCLERPRQRRRSRKTRYPINEAASDPRYFPLLLFPEGAPTTGDAITQFDPDFFVTDYAVQPVAVQYFLALTPRGFNSLHPGESVIDFFWRVFSMPWITVTVYYLTIEAPKRATDGRTSAALCQLAIANCIGVRAVSKHT
jgi:hypothetical protein